MFGNKRRAEQREITRLAKQEIEASYRSSLKKAVKEVMKSKEWLTLRVASATIYGKKRSCSIHFEDDISLNLVTYKFERLQSLGDLYTYTFRVSAWGASGATSLRTILGDFDHTYRDEYRPIRPMPTFDTIEELADWVSHARRSLRDVTYIIDVKKAKTTP